CAPIEALLPLNEPHRLAALAPPPVARGLPVCGSGRTRDAPPAVARPQSDRGPKRQCRDSSPYIRTTWSEIQKSACHRHYRHAATAGCPKPRGNQELRAGERAPSSERTTPRLRQRELLAPAAS